MNNEYMYCSLQFVIETYGGKTVTVLFEQLIKY